MQEDLRSRGAAKVARLRRPTARTLFEPNVRTAKSFPVLLVWKGANRARGHGDAAAADLQMLLRICMERNIYSEYLQMLRASALDIG